MFSPCSRAKFLAWGMEQKGDTAGAFCTFASNKKGDGRQKERYPFYGLISSTDGERAEGGGQYGRRAKKSFLIAPQIVDTGKGTLCRRGEEKERKGGVEKVVGRKVWGPRARIGLI